ncbi:MAG: Zn-ribbon domain-containing OB-fold protein [Syntrophomonadaceae bacterium]|nr:Zn-ribbon domain-containing OB-fold protein [Syntrophomonadaceae bacterium]
MPKRPGFLWPANRNSPSGRPFWEGLRQGRFLAPRCRACGELFFPPRPFCPECLGEELEWQKLSGRGTLHSWTELHYARPEFSTPFLLGLIDLEEGVGRIIARIEDASGRELQIGQPMEIQISEVEEGFCLYQARPGPASASQSPDQAQEVVQDAGG